MNTRLEKNAKALLDILHKRGHTDVTVLMTRGDVRSAVDVVEIPRDGRPES